MVEQISPLGDRRSRGRPKKGDFSRPLKELLIEATVAVISREGTTDANARRVADIVGVQPASINYNFGSWNALIAHAALSAYAQYSGRIWSAAISAGSEPEARLKAFIREQVAWAEEDAGWAAFFNFPISAHTASDILFDKFGQQMRQQFQLNYARLYRLVRDVSEGKVTDDPHWAEKTAPESIMADEELLTDAIVTSWTSLGMQIWSSRHQSDVLGGDPLRYFNERSQVRALGTIVGNIKGST